MADLEKIEPPRNENNEKNLDRQQDEEPKSEHKVSNIANKEMSESSLNPIPLVAKRERDFNLPGHPHVVEENKSMIEIPSPTGKQLRVSPLQIPVKREADPCISPETGKRRRIQHDYRRLSSSGYLDDYTGSGRERRFSSTSDSEHAEANCPPTTPPKVKPIKIKLPKPANESPVNGVSHGKLQKLQYTIYLLFILQALAPGGQPNYLL